MKFLSVIFVVAMLFAGGGFSSCKYTPVAPDTTKKCDTCHKPCDTCNKPCDTCNIDKDSAAHAFIWTEYIDKMPGETSPTGVWVFGKNDIYIVANSLWHFDGSTFTVVPAIRKGSNTTLNGGLNGCSIFAFSKNELWLVDGSVSLHTSDGKNYDDFRAGTVSNCWGSSPNDVFIVGSGGHIAHYDGIKFTQMTSNTLKNIESVWGTSGNNVWAAGFNPSTAESVLLHFDGTSWTSIDPLTVGNIAPFHHALNEIWAIDSLNHSIAIAGGSLLWRKTDNLSWRSDSGKISNGLGDGSFIGLYHIRGNNINDFIVTGDGGFISHWNGKTWMRYDNLYNPNAPLYLTNSTSMKDNTICIVGKKGSQSWIAIGQRKQ
jgi:hypothetical protein